MRAGHYNFFLYVLKSFKTSSAVILTPEPEQQYIAFVRILSSEQSIHFFPVCPGCTTSAGVPAHSLQSLNMENQSLPCRTDRGLGQHSSDSHSRPDKDGSDVTDHSMQYSIPFPNHKYSSTASIPHIIHVVYMQGPHKLLSHVMKPLAHFRKEWWISCKASADGVTC